MTVACAARIEEVRRVDSRIDRGAFVNAPYKSQIKKLDTS